MWKGESVETELTAYCDMHTELVHALASEFCYASCRIFVQNMLQQQQKHVCTMTTVSDIIQKQGLLQIDLLKIDVERAELDVLMGIAEPDWQRISQLVMEVHNVHGRLEHIIQLLKQNGGFPSVTITQDEQLKGSTIFNIYCCRTESKASTSYTSTDTTLTYQTISNGTSP